jgi:type VI secretion system protein ImpJ
VILFGDEARDDFEAIKIAELVRDSRGALIVNEAYIAPCLRIDSSPFLMGGVRRLLALMVAKQRRLSVDRRQRDGAAISFDAGDITRFLQLSAINGAIPVLTHAAKNGESNPLNLYMLLAQVAGYLATFSNDVDPANLPVFKHTELRGTFEELIAVVTGLLHEIRETYMTVALETAQGVYVGKLEDERVLKSGQVVLAVTSKSKEITEDQLAQRLPGLCKIASRTRIPQIMRAASPGVPVQVSRRPPSEIPVRAGVVYFALDVRSEDWRHVTQDRTIAIYLPPPIDPDHVQVDLLAVPASR